MKLKFEKMTGKNGRVLYTAHYEGICASISNNIPETAMFSIKKAKYMLIFTHDFIDDKGRNDFIWFGTFAITSLAEAKELAEANIEKYALKLQKSKVA